MAVCPLTKSHVSIAQATQRDCRTKEEIEFPEGLKSIIADAIVDWGWDYVQIAEGASEGSQPEQIKMADGTTKYVREWIEYLESGTDPTYRTAKIEALEKFKSEDKNKSEHEALFG